MKKKVYQNMLELLLRFANVTKCDTENSTELRLWGHK